MAVALNKSRILYSKIAFFCVIAITIIGKEFFPHETTWHEAFDYTGYLLIAICALGRLYSTAFLGGFKNNKLITYGVFSIVRNPLYFFSLLGFTGIALISNHPVIIVGLPIFFIWLYHSLIKREEGFLLEAFGKEYKEYMQNTPRIIPNFSLYNAPKTVSMSPKFVNKAFADAIWWFAVYPLIELVEYLHDLQVIKAILPF